MNVFITFGITRDGELQVDGVSSSLNGAKQRVRSKFLLIGDRDIDWQRSSPPDTIIDCPLVNIYQRELIGGHIGLVVIQEWKVYNEDEQKLENEETQAENTPKTKRFAEDEFASYSC